MILEKLSCLSYPSKITPKAILSACSKPFVFTSQRRHMTGILRSMYCKCAHKGEEPQVPLNQQPLGALLELWPSRTMQLPAVNAFFQPSIIQGWFFNGSKDKLWTLFWSNLITVTALSLAVYNSLSQWENKPWCPFLCHDFEVYHVTIQSGWRFFPDFIIRKKKESALQINKSPA